EKSLAVLPMNCIVITKEDDEFCRGLGGFLTARLASLEVLQNSFWMTPATEVRSTGARTVRDARRALGVNYALTAETTVNGENVRVAAMLVDTREEQVISRFSRDLSRADRNVFESQREGLPGQGDMSPTNAKGRICTQLRLH